MQNVSLLNVRSLFSTNRKLDELATNMSEHDIQAFGLIEARTSPEQAATLTTTQHLGFGLYVPPHSHPPCGGLAVLYRLTWEINIALTSYTRATDNNSERLTFVLNHPSEPATTLTIVLIYVPPSATTVQSKLFWLNTF